MTEAQIAGDRPIRRSGQPVPSLTRTTFQTSRLIEFCNRKELVNQTGHEVADWPLVIAKELVDNAIDSAEEANIAPMLSFRYLPGPERSPSATTGPASPPRQSPAYSTTGSAPPRARPMSAPLGAPKAMR